MESCCVRALAARFHGGPVPARCALTETGGQSVCLAFEERESGSVPAVSPVAAGRHAGN